MKFVALIGLVTLLLILSGCVQQSVCGNGICEIGETPDNCSDNAGSDCPPQEMCGTEICNFAEGFSIKYPANWSKATDTLAGAIFVPSDEMTVLMVSKLTGIEGKKVDSLDELVNQLLAPLKKTGTFSLIEESSNSLNGIEAKDITFSFEEKGEIVNTRIIATEKDGAFYLLALSGPTQQFNRDLLLFEESASSFKFQ